MTSVIFKAVRSVQNLTYLGFHAEADINRQSLSQVFVYGFSVKSLIDISIVCSYTIHRIYINYINIVNTTKEIYIIPSAFAYLLLVAGACGNSRKIPWYKLQTIYL